MAEGQDQDPDRNTRWAEERTEWAEDRTVLAVERTFAGWMRTAFGAIGIGLAFRAVFGDFNPPWLARAIATLFILLGAAMVIGAERRARNSLERLKSHEVDAAKGLNMRWLAWAIALGAAVLVAGLWALDAKQLTAG